MKLRPDASVPSQWDYMPEWIEPAEHGDVRLITVLDDQSHLPEAKWLREAFPNASIGFRSNSREVQLHATLAGAGVAALACYRADLEPSLVRLRNSKSELVRDIWLGVHVDMRHMPRVRAVSDTVVEALKENSSILNPKTQVSKAAQKS